MKDFYKRLRYAILATIFIFCCLCGGCKEQFDIVVKKEYPMLNESGLSAVFMDVGQGDCTIIKLPDDKILIIDCGDKSQTVEDYILQTLKNNGVKKIDYLILSHPDTDHIGNAEAVISEFEIGKAYLPHILNVENFPLYKNAEDLLKDKAEKIYVSETGRMIKGEEYLIYFLLPLNPDKMAEYDDLNYGEQTSDKINAVSAVVFLEYAGKKFIFSGDTTKECESRIVEYQEAGFYGLDSVSVKDVDFLKVSHHGGREEINESFYKTLNPKNAVISVGANNIYGHPSTYTLKALQSANPDINIFRTDVDGSINVYVSKSGETEIKTEKYEDGES